MPIKTSPASRSVTAFSLFSRSVSSNILYIETDKQFRIVSVSQALLNLLRASKELLCSRFLTDVLYPIQQDCSLQPKQFAQSTWDSLRNDPASAEIVRYIGPDQQAYSFRVSLLRIKSKSNCLFQLEDLTDVILPLQERLHAVNQLFAVIEFDPTGIIHHANDKFLLATGYELDEIVGQHHRIFVPDHLVQSDEYREFWNRLQRGERFSGEFHRIRKDGSDLFLFAAYNPLFASDGSVEKVVKYASDITDSVQHQIRSYSTSEEISRSVGQFADTINEISSNVSRTANLSSEAARLVQETCTSMRSLDESSRVIGNIVKIIQELAEQTNLLALNATIESARAGEAGRGFSVVANSVKALAKQTSNATKEIDKSVREIQGNISTYIQSTEHVAASVSQVSANMSSIAAAVEEQSVTVKSIARTAEELTSISRGS